MKKPDDGQMLRAWSKVPNPARTMIRVVGAVIILANFGLEFAMSHPHNMHWVAVQFLTIGGGLLAMAPELVMIALEKIPLPESWTR